MGKVRGHARLSVARQVLGRRIQLVRHQHDLARNQAGIGLLAKSQDQVERIADGVDRAHAQIEVAFDVRMLFAEFADDGGQEQLCKAGRQGNAQAPFGLHRHVQELIVRDTRFFHDVPAALKVDGARFGQIDLAGAAVEQPHADAAFQFAHAARKRGGRNVQGFGGVAEILALGDLDEERDVVKLDIHVALETQNSISGRFIS
ncbi:hypothetical protein D3C71_269270 [compost metagenome]